MQASPELVTFGMWPDFCPILLYPHLTLNILYFPLYSNSLHSVTLNFLLLLFTVVRHILVKIQTLQKYIGKNKSSLAVPYPRCNLFCLSVLPTRLLKVLVTSSDGRQKICVPHTHHQEILRHPLGVLRFNPILILSTWRYQIPQVKGSVPQDCPHFRHQTQVQTVTCALH